MSALRTWLSRLGGLLLRRDRRIEAEIQSHLELLAAEYEARGLAPDKAYQAARRSFGGVTATVETWREQRGLPGVERCAQDLRYAVRQLLANRGFAAAAVLTLALGIGANTAIFRVLDVVMLRSLPVREPERLVLVEGFRDGTPMAFSYPLFRSMAERQQVLQGMCASVDVPQAQPSDPKARLASGDYFRVLGADARLGRVFNADDDRAAAPAVAVVSYSYWQNALGGGYDVLGRTVTVGRVSAAIVGVMPPAFFGERLGGTPDVWLPIAAAPLAWRDIDTPALAVLRVMGREGRGVQRAEAQASLALLYNQLRDLSFRTARPSQYRLELQPGSQGLRELQEQFGRPVTVLMVIVGLVLLIASSNLANLLLARAGARTHEIGVRLALGASRVRIIRQLLTESLLLALLGAILGLVLAAWGSDALLRLASDGASWRISLDFGWRALAFTGGSALLAVCLFGVAPAFAATRLDVHSALQATRTAGSRRGGHAARGFVVAQVTLSLLLVSGASLLVRSFWNILHQDFGYRPEHVLFAQVPFDLTTRKEQPLAAVVDRIRTLPGVRAAAYAGVGPFSAFISTGVGISTPERPARPGEETRVASISPGYLEAMGIPIVAGRPITERDTAANTLAVVLSETAARTVFGVADPIGRSLTFGPAFEPSKTVQVIGVARDIRFSSPRDPQRMVAYVPFAQRPAPLSSIVVRTAGDPAGLATATRQAISATAPRLKLGAIQPLDMVLKSDMRQERMMALLSGAFGILALVLAAMGVYGVMAYGVQRRTREIGVRVALGARRSQVVGLLLREALGTLAVGLMLGGAGTVAIGRWVRTLLFGLPPHDPAALIGAALLLSATAIAAAWLPARRAARLAPVAALRQD